MPTILVVDDDPDILQLVRTLLERAGHAVVAARDGQEAMKRLFERKPDLIVLDIGMPGMDGWAVLERTREVSDVPVLMLTAESDELDKVRGLRGGADDFVTKPFGRQELLARVEVLLRRRASAPAAAAADVSVAGAFQVDHEQRIARVGDEELKLTPLEFRLLSALVQNPKRVLPGDRLIELVWGDEYVAQDQVKLLVGRLRKKLAAHVEADPIETVRGVGYRFSPA